MVYYFRYRRRMDNSTTLNDLDSKRSVRCRATLSVGTFLSPYGIAYRRGSSVPTVFPTVGSVSGCWVRRCAGAASCRSFFFFSLLLSSLELSDTQVSEPQVRTLLGIASRFCEEVVHAGPLPSDLIRRTPPTSLRYCLP